MYIYIYYLDSARLIFENIARVAIDARIADCIYCMPGAAGFFASAAVGRGKVNWTRRYSVYILRWNWFSLVVDSMRLLREQTGRPIRERARARANKSEILFRNSDDPVRRSECIRYATLRRISEKPKETRADAFSRRSNNDSRKVLNVRSFRWIVVEFVTRGNVSSGVTR